MENSKTMSLRTKIETQVYVILMFSRVRSIVDIDTFSLFPIFLFENLDESIKKGQIRGQHQKLHLDKYKSREKTQCCNFALHAPYNK